MKKLLLIFIIIFSTLSYASHRKIYDFQISNLRFRDNFDGVLLFKDDLDNSLMHINGIIESDFPLTGVFISLDNGKSFFPSKFEKNKFMASFMIKDMDDYFVFKLKFTDKSGTHNWKINYPIHYINMTKEEYLKKKTIDLFSYIERGQGDLAIEMFSREYPFYYSLEDKLRALHGSISTLGYRLFTVCTKKYDSNTFSVDMEWDRLKNGVSFHGFNRIYYKRYGNDLKIYRIKGDFPF